MPSVSVSGFSKIHPLKETKNDQYDSSSRVPEHQDRKYHPVLFVANHPSTDCEPIYTFSGMYKGSEEVVGRLCKYTKGGAMILVGVESMHGSVMNSILSMWNDHIKEIEKNA